MAHLNKFSKIKEDILEASDLKFQGLDKGSIPEKNVADFLKVFFTKYNAERNTVYCSNGKIQSKPGLRRSIGDIFKITHYYFPKASLTKMYIRLTTLLAEGIIVSAVCSEINKRVYRLKTSYDKSTFFNGPLTDEYGIDFSLYDLQNCTFNTTGWGTSYTEENLDIKTL